MREMAQFKVDKYLADLKNLDFFLLQEFNNINDMYNIYQDKLVEIIDKNAKVKIETIGNSRYIKVNKN